MLENDAGRQEPADGWMMSSITVRTEEGFLNTQWQRSLARLLELSCSELPGGRSWRVKVSNLHNQQLEEEVTAAFLEAIQFAATRLARECALAAEQNTQLSASAIDAMAAVLDYSKPLYNFYPASRTRTSSGAWEPIENEGFYAAYEAAIQRFLDETHQLADFATVMERCTDVQVVIRLVRTLSMIKYKWPLPDVPRLVEAACNGLKHACSVNLPANRTLLRDATEEIMRLTEDENKLTVVTPDNTPPIHAWKKIALDWFASDKLKLRRAGLEQLGEVSKHLVLNCSLSKRKVTDWLRAERVLESTFIDRPDERILPCVEELLSYIEIDRDVIDMLLTRAGSKAVQKVLGNACLQPAFSENTSARLLDGATRQLLLQDSADAASLLKAALSESKQTRNTLVRKGKKCALAVVRALVAIMLIRPKLEEFNAEEENQIIDALHQVCHDNDARSLRRYTIDLLLSTILPSEQFLPEPVKLRMEDMEASLGSYAQMDISEAAQAGLDMMAPTAPPFPSLVRPDANREAAYKAVRRLLSLFINSNVSYSFSTSSYSEYSSRGECLRAIEEEWGFRDMFFSDLDVNCQSQAALWPRLDLFAFFVRFSPQPSALSYDELLRIWTKAKALNAQELFCFWLTNASSRDCNPYIAKICLRDALERLFTREELIQGSHQTFLCMQTLFLEANVAYGLLDGDQDHEDGSHVYRQSHPPSDRAGQKLVGKRVSVLHSDGRMQQGIVTAYKDVWGTHSIEYLTGTVEEKQIDELNEWWLLPNAEDAKAGSVIIKDVRKNETLIGLDQIWTMALESVNEFVATKATDLLVALHQRSMCESFIKVCYQKLIETGRTLVDKPRDGIVDVNVTALRCIALLRNLDTYTRSGLPQDRRIPSHGHRGRGLPVRVVVDMNQPVPLVGPMPASSAGKFHTFEMTTNTTVDEFVRTVCLAAKESSACQVSVDPQSEGTLGGLGIPTAADEPGADSTVLEEIGVLPGPVATRVTLGTKSAIGPSPKKQIMSDSLALVPYDPESAILAPQPPQSPNASPPTLLSSNEYSLPSPSPSPTLEPLTPVPIVEDQSMDVETPGPHLTTTASSLQWSYSAENYHTLFDFLDVHSNASPVLKNAVWEFLQGIPTFANDEEATINEETAIVPQSIYRTLYRFRILGVRYQKEYTSSPTQEEAAGFNRLVERILDTVTARPNLTEMLLPSISGVLHWAFSKAVVFQSFPAAIHCSRIAQLLLTLKVDASANGFHDCTKVKRVPPGGRLCDDCVRTRRKIRATIELIETFRLILRAGGRQLWTSFFTSPMSRSVLWDVLVSHPIAPVREAIKRVLEEVTCSELVDALTLCERRLETDLPENGAVTCEQFFQILTDRVSISVERSGINTEMFERLCNLVLGWRAVHNSSESSDLLLIGFTKLLHRLVPESVPDGRRLLEAFLDQYVLNIADLDLIQRDKVRESVAEVVRQVAKATQSSALVLKLVDEFLLKTPIPLRRQDKGWGFAVDWSVDPSSTDSGGLRLRKSGSMVGLVNRGSTCYANSVLQMLFSVRPFREAILNAKLTPKPASQNQPVKSEEGMAIAPPPPPPVKKKQSIAKGWQCWCSTINDLTAFQCRICEMPRREDYELVSESFSYAMSHELMSQLQQVEVEEDQQLAAAIRASSNSSGVTMKEDAPVEILRQLQRVFAYLNYSRLNSFDPFRLITASKPLNLQFPVTSQNDASEYYDKLLDAVDGGLTKEGNENATQILKDCFLGKQVKLKRCQVCDTVSYSKDEEFYRLELTVKNEQSTKNDLKECLEAFTAPEDMFGDNKVDCEFCQTRTNTTFVTCLTSIPQFLFIHPKRFAYDLDSNQTVKLNHRISFPHELDLFPYTREGVVFSKDDGNGGEREDSTGGSGSDESPDNNNNIVVARAFTPNPSQQVHSEEHAIWYDLSGVLVHRGRAGGGHYYAFIESSDDAEFSNPNDLNEMATKQAATSKNRKRQWVHYNDERVSHFDLSKLPDECFGGRMERSTTDQWGISRTETIDNEKSAFMLLYVRRQSVKESSPKTVDDDKIVPEPMTSPSSKPKDVEMKDTVLDLSDRDMFQEHWEQVLEEDHEVANVSYSSYEEEESFGPSSSKSVPKPMAVFAASSRTSTTNPLAQASLSRARELMQQKKKDIMQMEDVPMVDSLSLESEGLAALRKEVEEANMAVTRQALLFSPITQELFLTILKDLSSSLSSSLEKTLTDESLRDSVSVLAPVFRFFFEVVTKSKHSSSSSQQQATGNSGTSDNNPSDGWIACLNQILDTAEFEQRTKFADQLFSTWINAPSFVTSDSEIGPPMGTMFSLADILLECPEKRVRQFYLEGVCAVLKHASQITIRSLVEGILKSFQSQYESLSSTSKQRTYLEGILAILDRICMQGGSSVRQVVLESGAIDSVLGALLNGPLAQTTGGTVAQSSSDMIVSCCSFVYSFLKEKRADDRHFEKLKSSQLRNLLLEVGLNNGDESVQRVLLGNLEMTCRENLQELDGFLDKLLETMHTECNSSGTNSMANELPYDTSMVSNVLGEHSDQARKKFLSRVIMTCAEMDHNGVALEAALSRLIDAAWGAIMTPGVVDALELGALMPLSRNVVWEEKLFPLDATNLRITCRILACIVQTCLPQLLRSSSYSQIGQMRFRAFQQALEENPRWKTLKVWFMCASSPFNQLGHVNGLDTDGIRKLRAAMKESVIDGEDEQHVGRLMGVNPSEICLRVEGAGTPLVNGLYYYQTPMINHYPRWMSENGLSIYRCALTNGSEEWFLSRLEPGCHPSDERNTDYYCSTSFPKSSQLLVPHPADWTLERCKGRPPQPLIRKLLVKDLLNLDLPPVDPPPPPLPILLGPPVDNSSQFNEDPVLARSRMDATNSPVSDLEDEYATSMNRLDDELN